MRAGGHAVSPFVRSVSVSIDGKRLGCPQGETEIYAAWTWPEDVAMWLPVKVYATHNTPS